MFRKFHFYFTSKAFEDLNHIFRSISEKLSSATAATGIALGRIEQEIMRLKELPFSGGYVADDFLKIKATEIDD